MLAPDWRFVDAVADPTHRRLLDVQTFWCFCGPRPGVPPWRPMIDASGGFTVHADLQPVKNGRAPATPEAPARRFA